MQNNDSAEQFTSDLVSAYESVKTLVSRLQRAFDQVEDEAVLNGKAFPLVRLLHSLLRTQIQIAEKIERRRQPANNAERAANQPSRRRAASTTKLSRSNGNHSAPLPALAVKQASANRKANQQLYPHGATPPLSLLTAPLSGAIVHASKKRTLPWEKWNRGETPSKEKRPAPGLLMR